MKHRYRKITKPLLNEFISIAGHNNIFTDAGDLDKYSVDESTMATSYQPEIVIKPTDLNTVSRILYLANKNRIPVTPRGAGTGVSGGCVPLFGGILLSMEKMNQILEIDRNNYTAEVETGVSLAQLDEELLRYGLFYPVQIGDMTATVGGNIATNAGGLNAVKYGVTRNHVIGLETLLPDGKIIRTGGKYVKCSTGYDLTQLFIGSEGTLAVITKIMLKLLARPSIRELIFIPFNNLQDAINSVPELLKLNTIPTGIEFIDNEAIKLIEQYMDIEVPYHEQEAFLMILMEGSSYDQVISCFSEIEMICRNHGAVEFLAPTNEKTKRKILDIRDKIQPAIKKAGKSDLIDAVVPRNEIAIFVSKVKQIAAKYGIPVITFGHAGDGNIHLHPLCSGMSMEEWLHKMPYLMQAIYETAVSLGGTISGEHGIGLEKKKYLNLAVDSNRIELMKQIKTIFDPNNILNPGKIFDVD